MSKDNWIRYEEIMRREAEYQKKKLESDLKQARFRIKMEAAQSIATIINAQNHNLMMAGIFGEPPKE